MYVLIFVYRHTSPGSWTAWCLNSVPHGVRVVLDVAAPAALVAVVVEEHQQATSAERATHADVNQRPHEGLTLGMNCSSVRPMLNILSLHPCLSAGIYFREDRGGQLRRCQQAEGAEAPSLAGLRGSPNPTRKTESVPAQSPEAGNMAKLIMPT